MKKFIILLIILTIAGFAYAQSKEAVHSIVLPAVKTELAAGKGKDTTEKYCSI